MVRNIDSYRSVTGAAELLEQLVNADAVGAGSWRRSSRHPRKSAL